MTSSEMLAILDQLEAVGPQRRLSGKRAQLVAIRDRLLALHARGYSWRAIARELTVAGEKVSADLLRSVCRAKAKRRTAGRIADAPPNVPAHPQRAIPATNNVTSDGRFGAKGLKP